MPGPRPRLDLRLVELGLAPSREKAQALVLAGRVQVAGRRIDKPGTAVKPGAAVEVTPLEHPWVGRGGMKLAGALDALGIDPRGHTALDLGASTGGFTDCLLQRGALRVYAVDVGHGLIDARLAADPRVVLLERVNARYLSAKEVPEPVTLAVADLAFISLRLVLPALVPLLAPGAVALVLVKPQFELGRGEVGRGVVRDPAARARAVLSVAEAARALGFAVRAVTASPVPGQKGNREFFLLLDRAGQDLGASLAEAVRAACSG